MLISEVLPLIDEAANRVYALVRETPLVALASEGRRLRPARLLRSSNSCSRAARSSCAARPIN